MKTSLPSFVRASVWLVIFSSVPAAARSESPADDRAASGQRPIIAYPAEQDGPGLGKALQVGSSRTDVRLLLGRPDLQLSNDVWVYRHHTTTHDDINANGYDTLILVFAHDRVADQRLVTRASVDALVARMAAARRAAQASAANP